MRFIKETATALISSAISCTGAIAQALTDDTCSMLQPLSVADGMIQQNPKDGALYVQRSQIYQCRKNFPQAIADINKAIELKWMPEGDTKDKGTLYLMRATCYMFMKNYNAAISDLNTVIRIAPGDSNAFASRAALFGEQKQYSLAMKDYTRSLQLDPAQPAAYEGIGEILVKTGQNAKAIEYLNRAVTIDNKNGGAFYYRSLAFKALGKNDQAQKDAERSTALGFKVGEFSLHAMRPR